MLMLIAGALPSLARMLIVMLSATLWMATAILASAHIFPNTSTGIYGYMFLLDLLVFAREFGRWIDRLPVFQRFLRRVEEHADRRQERT